MREITYSIGNKEYTAKIPEQEIDHFVDGIIKSNGIIKIRSGKSE
jgi:hypothetical protein